MGRGCTMDEWIHFERLPDEGRVPNSSYWYVHCRHCVRGYEQKQLVNPPAKLTGRRSAMKAHLKVCPLYATQYKMEQRALAVAAAAAAATASVEVADAAMAAAATTSSSASASDVETPTAARTATAPTTPLVGTVTIKTQSGEKRKRRGEDVEASGPRGGRGKHCMMEEWEHFIRLQDEGYIGKSNFFYAVCRHCQLAYDEAPDDKKAMLVPEKMVGRREKMRKHLTHCPHFQGELPSLERRTQVRSTGPNAFLPMPTADGIKMVPASALASVAAIEAAGLVQPGGLADVAESVDGAQPSARLALDEWQYFTRLHRKKDSAYYFARCNFCQQAFENAPEPLKASMTPTVVMGRKSNMQTHLAKCPYVPKDAVLFNKAVLAGSAFALGRENYAVKRFKMAGPADTGSASLYQILIEFLLQHRLPFEWVDSLSAKKLLTLAAVGAQVDSNVVPSSEVLRGPILDDLVRMELHPDIDKLKQLVSLPPAPVPSVEVGEDGATVAPTPATTPFPMVVKVSLSKSPEDDVPSVECSLSGNGISVPVQYIGADKVAVDEDSLITGIASGTTSLSYYHGLDVARYLGTQLRRIREDHDIVPAVVMLPQNPVMSRAVGLLRAQYPQLVFVWNLEDMVAFCLCKALQNPVIAEVITAVTDLVRVPEIEAEFVANGFAPSDDDDWTSFASLAQELYNMTAFHATIDSKVERTSLARVIALFRAFTIVDSTLVIGGRVTLADTLTHLATLYSAADGFDDVQLAVEVVWHACEQPLYLLTHALHPQMRLRNVASTDLTKLSVLSDFAVSYFTQFLERKPLSLRGDVTSYLHMSQDTFTDAFIAEFPQVDDYYRYLRDTFPELAALMHLLQSYSVNGVSVDDRSKGHSKTLGYSDDEQKKLSLLEERWGVEVAAYRGDETSGHGEAAGVDMTEAARAETETPAHDVVDKWIHKLDTVLSARMVDFSQWEANFQAGGTDQNDQNDSAANAVAGDMTLPSQAHDDPEAYVGASLKGARSKKVRLAQLFSGNESTTV